MNLLNLKVPSTLRIQYSNLLSQQIWGGKIREASKLYPRLEYETVAHDVRKCMIDHTITKENLIEKSRFYAQRGMLVLPVDEEMVGAGFGHSTDGNGRRVFRTVVTKSKQDALDFLEYSLKHDHNGVGKLLGFPERTTEFFTDVWARGYIDPIWQQAENTSKPMLKSNTVIKSEHGIDRHIIRLNSDSEFDITSNCFRYFGVRTISHFPYSFDDKESLKVAKKWVQLAKDLKADGLNETLEIMRLPYEWDCLKGIATVTTPVFKLTVDSVPCFPQYTIQRESDYYPEEAPKGIQFPWKLK